MAYRCSCGGEIRGTLETVPTCAAGQPIRRPDGKWDIEYAGGSEVFWDDQRPQTADEDDAILFLCLNGCTVKGDMLIDDDTTSINCKVAEQEGWAIFDGDSGFRIERDNDVMTLVDDEHAWRLVAQRASYGSALHLDALRFIRSAQHESGREWKSICTFLGRDPLEPEPEPATDFTGELQRLVSNYIGVMEDYHAGFPITDPDHPHHEDWTAAKRLFAAQHASQARR